MSNVYSLQNEEEDDELEPRPALPFNEEVEDDLGDDDFDKVPTTAEEYLRMVRRQARKVPDIVHKPLDKAQIKAPTFKLDYDDIPTCDDQLLCRLSWEKHFLKEFAGLRDAVHQHAPESRSETTKLPSTKIQNAWQSYCFGDDATAPTLSLVAQMDSSTKNQILWIFSRLIQQEMETTVPAQLDAHAACWLFALLAVTDKPADADTGAALRSILRSLCSIRAQLPSASHSSLPSLNILISILGTFFGQMPARAETTADIAAHIVPGDGNGSSVGGAHADEGAAFGRMDGEEEEYDEEDEYGDEGEAEYNEEEEAYDPAAEGEGEG